jgi:hypothetical protein
MNYGSFHILQNPLCNIQEVEIVSELPIF